MRVKGMKSFKGERFIVERKKVFDWKGGYCVIV